MQGFILYMIVGAIIHVYRMYFADVHPNDPWKANRKKHLKTFEEASLPLQLVFILVFSVTAIPVLLTDALLIINHKAKMYIKTRRALSAKAISAGAEYLRFGILYGEAVSYSVYNRFSAEDREELEILFKEAEKRIVKYGIEPLKLGDFVARHQDGTPLPNLRIKGVRKELVYHFEDKSA
jgi:hypothetical protein